MAKQLFANGASAELAVDLEIVDTTVQVQAGYGALFPSPTGGDWFLVTLEDASANVEVVKCTARSGDLLTVTRAQEGTPAQAFTNTVTRVECRNTKGSMERMLQRSGDTLGGNLNLGGFELSDGSLAASVSVPNTSVFPVGMIVLWSGSLGSVPAGWALCNGANGTPDLRDRFVVGAGNSYAVAATGGSATPSGTTGAGGDHTHGGATGSHALTEAQMPAHNHRIFAANTTGDSNADGWGRAGTRGIPGEDVAPFGYREQSNAGDVLIEDAGSGEGHTHTIPASGTHTHTLTMDARPPYYALAYIMFTG